MTAYTVATVRAGGTQLRVGWGVGVDLAQSNGAVVGRAGMNGKIKR